MLDKRGITKAFIRELTISVTGAAIEVHRHLGPGLLESTYHKCLMHELGLRHIHYVSEMLLPIKYKGLSLAESFRCDLYIENCMVLELKVVEWILPVHYAQVLTYMKLLRAPKGMLVNFNAENIFKSGQRTFVNEFFTTLKEE